MTTVDSIIMIMKLFRREHKQVANTHLFLPPQHESFGDIDDPDPELFSLDREPDGTNFEVSKRYWWRIHEAYDADYSTIDRLIEMQNNAWYSEVVANRTHNYFKIESDAAAIAWTALCIQHDALRSPTREDAEEILSSIIESGRYLMSAQRFDTLYNISRFLPEFFDNSGTGRLKILPKPTNYRPRRR
jgi:hypothetical protein